MFLGVEFCVFRGENSEVGRETCVGMKLCEVRSVLFIFFAILGSSEVSLVLGEEEMMKE